MVDARREIEARVSPLDGHAVGGDRIDLIA